MVNEAGLPDMAAMAPSAKLLFLSGRISSQSYSRLMPRPPQVGQAPYGALNEKRRGSISGRLMPQSGQENFSEYTFVSPPMTCTSMTPSANFNAVSTESPRRC